MKPPKWYRHYWAPWGKVIGYHEVAYPKIGGRTYEIRRYFADSSDPTAQPRVKHYCPHGNEFVTDGVPARFKSFAACVRFLQQRKG